MFLVVIMDIDHKMIKANLFFNFAQTVKFAENAHEQFPEKIGFSTNLIKCVPNIFCPDNFKTLSDRQAKSRKSKDSNASSRLRLKPKAILKLFPNLSHYL